MGIFNEQTNNHPFARGIQGAPGIGFSLTADGNYDINAKRLTNVGAPTANADAATKKYVDDNKSSSKTSEMTVDANIDMKDRYRILNLKSPLDADEPATKQYADATFLDREGGIMSGDINMNNHSIFNLPAPTGPKQPIPLVFGDFKYLHVAGTNKMTNNLNMDNKSIIHLKPPTNDTDGATKKYVDDTVGAQDLSDYLKKDGSVRMAGNFDMNNFRIANLPTPTSNNQPVTRIYGNMNYLSLNGIAPMRGNLNMNSRRIKNLQAPIYNNDAATKKYVDDNSGSPDLSDYLEKDGSVAMTGNLNMNSKKIINLSNPTSDKDATNKTYVDNLVRHTTIQPSHYADQFAYLMSSASQWTDETTGGNSFIVTKIDTLTPSNGNFHNYNHKVIYYSVNKNLQGGYNYKMGMNFYRLHANTDYTLCLELLNTEYLLWHKSQISVDKGSSTGLTLGRVSINKLSHKYENSGTKFMYYYKVIINFRKLSSGRYFLYVNVNIPQAGIDLNIYPRQFTKNYLVAYGIVGTFSNVDPDKVYDYHTAFDIKPTEVTYNVDVNMNQKEIKNVKLNRQDDDSVATIALFKELAPYTKDALYRLYFSDVWDFSDADSYKIKASSSGIVFNKITSSSNSEMDITDKTINNIKKEGLNVNNYTLSWNFPNRTTNFTLCIVFYHWRNRSFGIYKKDNNGQNLLDLQYTSNNQQLILDVGRLGRSVQSMLSLFNGKKIVIWLTQSSNNNLTTCNVSNYVSKLSVSRVQNANEQKFEFTTQDGVLSKIMFSPNFYNINDEYYHRVMLQEKLDGSYVI